MEEEGIRNERFVFMSIRMFRRRGRLPRMMMPMESTLSGESFMNSDPCIAACLVAAL